MKSQILFLGLGLLFASCGSKPHTETSYDMQGLPSDTVWMLNKGQHKTDVRNLFLSKGLRVEENASINSIIGISNRAISWVGADWDVAVCRFDESNNLSSVSIMRNGEFDNGDVVSDSLISVIYELQRKFGEAKPINSEKWQFINTQHTNASIICDRNTTIVVVWE